MKKIEVKEQEDSIQVKIKEDCEDFMRESRTYRDVLEHRRNCEKWGKKFCLDCFGGGLTRFTKRLDTERHLLTLQKSKAT